MTTKTGLERILQSPQRLQGKRIAVLANSASVTSDFRYAWDALGSVPGIKLSSIWSPQHGLFGQQQANMIESQHRIHPQWKVPIYSLYSETREPTDEFLDGVDLIVIDLQDVGTRVYTFAWTILACMKAASRRGVSICILDRPNPIGGDVAEGPLLQEGFQSFVGMERIPMRHGLTLGELAIFCKERQGIDVDLEVIAMAGWKRSMFFDETGLPWLPPSPNVPTWETALVYPGQVLLEGVMLSEGRGTTRPFECTGAPFIDGTKLAKQMNEEYQLPGVFFRPIQFVPTFDKFAGRECGGVFWHITDRSRFRSLTATIQMLSAIRQSVAEHFAWLPPPYEYEYKKPPIDILWGSDELRVTLDGLTPSNSHSICEIANGDSKLWWDQVSGSKIYD
jgi:uncharacterized protein YbbC (DUF1343 family)